MAKKGKKEEEGTEAGAGAEAGAEHAAGQAPKEEVIDAEYTEVNDKK